jgi:ectoine hydroxylase-related dioxygenase (phytanoyl-CoA dioxygenase family)
MELNALTIPRMDLSDSALHIREQFQQFGAVIVSNVLDEDLLERFRQGIRLLLHKQLQHATADNTPFSEDHRNLDQLFSTLCKVDRQRGGYVYDAIQWLPEYLEVLSASALVDAARALLNTEHVISPPVLSWVRIDRHGEERNYFPWHQDYTYNLASRPTITAWVPLLNVTECMGPLTVVPGSHHYHYPVAVQESDRYAALTDIDIEALEADAVTVTPQVGDALFFHELLLHRSGSNQSDRARWVLNARWADLNDPAFTERGWQFRRERSFQMLQQLHPDKYRPLADQPTATEQTT